MRDHIEYADIGEEIKNVHLVIIANFNILQWLNQLQIVNLIKVIYVNIKIIVYLHTMNTIVLIYLIIIIKAQVFTKPPN